MADFYEAVEHVLAHEGAYSYHPHDRGGKTIYGIASASWPDAYDEVMKHYPKNTAKALEVAQEFYRENFWKARPFDSISNRDVATFCFDMHVNHSFRAAGRIIQRACNALSPGQYAPLTEDGHMGPKTVRRINALSARYQDALMMSLAGERYKYYRTLVQRRPENASFMRGWAARCKPAGWGHDR